MIIKSGSYCRGFTKWLSQQCGAFSRALLDEKSKSPLFLGEGGAMVTNDWCITVSSVHSRSHHWRLFFLWGPKICKRSGPIGTKEKSVGRNVPKLHVPSRPVKRLTNKI